jgi:ABC-type amino acid transport substrate-binding protein
LIAAGMTATDERAEEIDFSIVYIEMGLKVIVPIDTRYRPSISST